MSQRLLFLTGHLAEHRLRAVLDGIAGATQGSDKPIFNVLDLGLQVAGLMSDDLIRRRLPPGSITADRVIVPGHCRGDLPRLAEDYGIAFERGPEDLHDLPEWFGQASAPVDLSQHDCRIFAEITDAPTLTIDAIVARAVELASHGADVIDIGCLPATPFGHLEEAVAAVQGIGLRVSVDSLDPADLRRAGRAGADFVLSLSEATLDLIDEIQSTPVIIPASPGDLASLERAADRLERSGRSFILDSILDPLPFGFTASILRYAELRRRRPTARILMGIGNVTELTDADTTGMHALLFGMIAELGITEVLTVEVSGHCRRAVAEADRARRLMSAAMRLQRLPVGIDPGLLALRDRRPFPQRPDDIAATARQVRDANYRIDVAEDGIHLYNRDGHHVARDAFDLYPPIAPALAAESDGGHAFYLGVELGRAQVAFELGKRYQQDRNLDWASAVDRPPEAKDHHRAPGTTREATMPSRRRRKSPAP